MPAWLWGKTGYSFFDVSMLVHFSFWFFIGSCTWYLRANRWWAMAICLLVACAWEVAEHFLEKSYPQYWKNPESWWNAWISDPLMCVAGLLLVWAALDAWTTIQ